MRLFLQIAAAEEIVSKVIAAKQAVDAMETPLAQAREINGLRAMFGASKQPACS